jgi:hypothetical protein
MTWKLTDGMQAEFSSSYREEYTPKNIADKILKPDNYHGDFTHNNAERIVQTKDRVAAYY